MWHFLKFLCVCVLAVLLTCGKPEAQPQEAQPGLADSPWMISLHGTVVLADGEVLQPGTHRIEVWIESPGCSVHSVMVLVHEDGHWNLDLSTEGPECSYGGTLTVKSAWINGKPLKPLQERYSWRLFGDPLVLSFRSP